tara:strand:+ start:430 stop:1002 length:573 start_codon:yes stop_codon:yes gene_type:complete
MSQNHSTTEVSEPAAEPISVSEAKTFLRISHDGDDAVLANYIKAARQFCEIYTGQCIISRSLKTSFSINGSTADAYDIPKSPATSISQVKVVQKDSTETVLDANTYNLDTTFNRIIFQTAVLAPHPYSKLDVFYTAGYGTSADDVPETLRHAVLMKAAQMYEHRGGVQEQQGGFDIIESLLRPYKKVELY